MIHEWREERRKVQELFRNDPQSVSSLATDAAGEGVDSAASLALTITACFWQTLWCIPTNFCALYQQYR